MTKREKIVVSAYTGILMCNFSDIQDYASSLIGRSLWTDEFGSKEVWEEIKNKSKPEFMEICNKESE